MLKGNVVSGYPEGLPSLRVIRLQGCCGRYREETSTGISSMAAVSLIPPKKTLPSEGAKLSSFVSVNLGCFTRKTVRSREGERDGAPTVESFRHPLATFLPAGIID
ncbi:hypothetical protein NPIL_74461 [Nephila pilipes]|uniref:Uncharacterized protein n=1 Tax=Nephila pilipes TaxID=299642 RepID=A0A8X6PVY5_NEPPI|nr:hypothetical protein NPIL_74461 [Nephila pilipes]